MGEIGIVVLSVGFIATIVFVILAFVTDAKKLWGILAGIASAFVIVPVIILALPPSAHKISTAEEFLELEEYLDKQSSKLSFHSVEYREVILEKDIDLEGMEYDSIDTGYENLLLDGNGHTIKNITFSTYEEDEEHGVGLFKGKVELKNITFENVNISYQGQTSSVGVVMGKAYGGTYENVTVSGKIDAPNAENVGGFIGEGTDYRESVFKNCTSSLEINGKTNVGGFIGIGLANVQNCKNTGIVNGDNYVGGIAGQLSGRVTGSENLGKVESTSVAGGIAGYVCKSCSVATSNNGGEVIGATQTGGIVGLLGENASIDSCVNLQAGKVTATSGDSDGNAKVGGIVGATEKGSKVYSCSNKGEVTSAYSKVGGIVGYSLGGVTDCRHEGSVSGANDVGGIIGHMKNNSMVSTCVVTGTVNGASRVGGIMGRFGSDDFKTSLKSFFGANDITIMNCSVSAEIACSSYGGGLIGLIVNDTVDGDYLETNTFDGKLTVGGVEKTDLWTVQLED